MKKLLIVLFVVVCTRAAAQVSSSPLPPLDKSPLDMSYFPPNYPILKIQDKITGDPVIRVIYSRPQVNGRKIFGELQEYGSVWRLGANEATEINFYSDVKINNKKIKKGRYTVYAIPYPDKWTFILNKDLDTWGSFKYDSTKDVIRVSLPVIKNDFTQVMTIVFDQKPGGANMDMYWEDAKVSLPISF